MEMFIKEKQRKGNYEQVFDVLGIKRDKNGNLYKMDGNEKVVFEDNFFDKLTKSIPGWTMMDENLLYQEDGENIIILGWKLIKPMYERHSKYHRKRVYDDSAKKRYDEFMKENMPTFRYVETEIKCTRNEFIEKRDEIKSRVKEEIKQKIGMYVSDLYTRFMISPESVKIFDLVPDDFIISLEDSFYAKNCENGTYDFIEKYFKNKTSTEAKNLKKFEDNFNVVRMFWAIAEREGFLKNN